MGVVASLLPPEACKAGLDNIAYTKKAMTEMGSKCDDLVAKLCKDLGDKSESCTMVKAQTPQFPPQQCDMMLQKYDQVLADLKAREMQNAPLPEAAFAKISNAEDSPLLWTKRRQGHHRRILRLSVPLLPGRCGRDGPDQKGVRR